MPAAPPSPEGPHQLRVLLAILRYFPHGGLQRIAMEAAKGLTRRGHGVDFMTLEFDGERPSDEIAVHEVPTQRRSNHGRAAAFGRHVEASVGYDVVLGFDRLPGLDLYFAGDPCFSARVRRTRGPLYRLTPRYRTFKALEASVFQPAASTRILLMDPSEQDLFRQEYGTPASRFTVLPPGFEASRAMGPDAPELRRRTRAQLRLEATDHLLLCLGSDFHRKGFDRAVRAAAAVSDSCGGGVVLAAAGADDGRALRSLARTLGFESSLRLLGPSDDVPGLLQAADLLVHPCRSEPAGMVLLESLSSGTPVVTTARAGYSHYVAASGAGVVVPAPFHQGDLNAAVQALLSRPRGELQRAALSSMEGIPPQGMIDGVIGAVEGNQGPAGCV